MMKITKLHFSHCQSVIVTLYKSESANSKNFSIKVASASQGSRSDSMKVQWSTNESVSVSQAPAPVAQGGASRQDLPRCCWAALSTLVLLERRSWWDTICHCFLSAGPSVFQRLRAYLLQLHICPHQHRWRHCHGHQGRPPLPRLGVCSVSPHR